MADRTRLFDDLAGVAGGAFSALAGLREEMESTMRARIDEAIRKLDLVKREDLDAVQEMAANARAGQEAAEARAQDAAARLNDYPTTARAEYVFACMAVNGDSRQSLDQCSCSIDWIASVLPHARYVEAEATLALQQTGGERAALFRDNALVRGVVADLRRAQAEAEIVCF